jgi:hypothetical protein
LFSASRCIVVARFSSVSGEKRVRAFFFLAMVDDENVRWKKLMRDVDFNNFSITHTQE